ncbi:hypothetical protein EON66_11885, partial [archaeon]
MYAKRCHHDVGGRRIVLACFTCACRCRGAVCVRILLDNAHDLVLLDRQLPALFNRLPLLVRGAHIGHRIVEPAFASSTTAERVHPLVTWRVRVCVCVYVGVCTCLWSLQTHRPVTPIFVTDAPSVLFSALDGSETLPVSIAFAPPTADTVRTLLYNACPPGEEPLFFCQFVDHVRPSRTTFATQAHHAPTLVDLSC